MPECCAIVAVRFGPVFDDVGQDQYFRVTRQTQMLQHVRLRAAKYLSETDKVFRLNNLTGKPQCAISGQCEPQFLNISAVQRTRQVKTDHIGTEPFIFDGLNSTGTDASLNTNRA